MFKLLVLHYDHVYALCTLQKAYYISLSLSLSLSLSPPPPPRFLLSCPPTPLSSYSEYLIFKVLVLLSLPVVLYSLVPLPARAECKEALPCLFTALDNKEFVILSLPLQSVFHMLFLNVMPPPLPLPSSLQLTHLPPTPFSVSVSAPRGLIHETDLRAKLRPKPEVRNYR